MQSREELRQKGGTMGVKKKTMCLERGKTIIFRRGRLNIAF
jgi:hypothetical protein